MPVTFFQSALIRITNADGKLCGMGCLVNPAQAITCAQVVVEALWIEHPTDIPPSGTLYLHRPLSEEPTRSRTAWVKAWKPPQEGKKLSNMALLQLDEPVESIAIALSDADLVYPLSFVTWCGKNNHELELFEGSIQEAMAQDRYLLKVKVLESQIGKNCCGAPVIDIGTGHLLGLITREESHPTFLILIPVTHWRQTGWFPQWNAWAALEPLKVWLSHHFQFSFLERQGIENFIDCYQGTGVNPFPFVGRTQELQTLDQWLAQSQERFLFLSGSAGLGKSTLLLHWLARLLSSVPTIQLIFLPLSVRFETSSELTGLRLLHAAFCDYLDELQFTDHNKPDIRDYREQISKAWEHMARQVAQRYLLVIDGIDESTHHWFSKDLLPTALPANVHLLLSARPSLTDGNHWFQTLSFQGKRLELVPLAPAAISDMFLQRDPSLRDLAEREALITQLYRLTQGEPLLLTLWMGQFWQHREIELTLSPLQPALLVFIPNG